MPEQTRWIRLGDLAHTRSGDKGDRSNIGVVANDAAGYAWLEIHLTDAGGRRILAADGHRPGRARMRSPVFIRSTSWSIMHWPVERAVRSDSTLKAKPWAWCCWK